MSKMLLIASAVLLLISAGLGFANKGKIAAKQADLEQSRTATKTAQGEAAKAKTAQKKSEKEAADALATSTALQGQLTAATTKVTELNGKVDEATKSIEDKEGKIKQLEDTIRVTTGNGPKTPDGPAVDLNAKIAEMQIQITELKTVKDQLESSLKTAQNSADKYRREIAARADGSSMNGLQGKVLAVNRDWNFVVLSLGNSKGVNSNATMVIQRGGSTVGKVRITSVEPSQSIADIIPNSVPPGIIVQPGDTVVFPGS